jgi:hypothetical protein
MFRHRNAVFRESTKLKERKSNTPLVILCVYKLPQDGTPVPKHVGIGTYYELLSAFVVFIY